MVDLLERPSREARLVFDQVLEVCLGPHLGAAPNRLVPVQIRAGPHGVYSGESANIAGEDAVQSEDKAGRSDQGSVRTRSGVLGIAPQRVVVTDSVGVVPDVVPGRLITPGLDAVGDWSTDGTPQPFHRVIGNRGEPLPAVIVD